MFDGREVWLTVETDAKSGRSWLEKMAERLTSTSNQVVLVIVSPTNAGCLSSLMHAC
jgi:hypothetical protein